MNLQWYPGHMTKARRAMEENLKLVDVVIEIRDARVPLSSANPDLAVLGKGRKRILILNKADLADQKVTLAWTEALKSELIRPLALDARKRNTCAEILKELNQLAAEKREKDLKRGIRNRPARLMVVGIPNVGKSTLINSLAGRASTKTGDKAGVTRGLQWIRLNASLELLDTPGILWPKFDDESVGLHLALTGAIREEVLPREELALKGMELLEMRYPQLLHEKYGLEGPPQPDSLEQLALRQGLLQKGAQADISRAAARFLEDLRKGRLGQISLEAPES
ncbi:MAG: ribosome biogenesis GTPase YlqF [Lachnospiraceae bacterium]|nr:ribosome biogenesis GTPase YlqF [Lachnospiraceae bacterium]